MMKSYISPQGGDHRAFSKVVNDVHPSDIDTFSRDSRRESMLTTLRLMGGTGVSDGNRKRTSFRSPAGSRKGSLTTSKRGSFRKGSLGFSNIKEEPDDGDFYSESSRKNIKLQDLRVDHNHNNFTSDNKTKGHSYAMSSSDDELSISESIELNKDKRKGSVLIKIDEAIGEPTSNGELHRGSINGRRGSLLHKLRDTLQSQISEDKPKSRNGRRGSTMSRLQDVVFDVRGGISGSRRASIKTSASGGFLATGQGGVQSSLRLHFQLKKLRQLNREKRLRKFRSSAKIIIFLYRLCKTHYLSANDKGTATRGHVDDDDQKELLFDVTYFKANRKAGISSDAKRILTMSAHERTDKEKYHCLISLRNYKTFAEYPIAMQQAIVQCAWYETYSAKRVILRQGHQPHNFYFILSGSVLVNVLEPGSQFAKTVVYLHKGETFGNYVQIFMAGGIATLFDPENDFVKNLKFLEGWPLHLLVGNRKKCVFSYFKRGDVLIKNSKTTDWILIVKSGSCSVMKRLKEVESMQSPRRRFSLSDANGFPDHQRYRKRMSLFPGLDKVGGRSFENFDQRKRREEFEAFLKDLDTHELYGNRKRVSDDKKDSKNDSKRVSFQEGDAEKEEGARTVHETLQDRRRSSGAKNMQAVKTFKIRRSTLPVQMKRPHLERRRAKSIAPNQQPTGAIEEDPEDEEDTKEEQSEDSEEDDPLKRFYKITGDTKVVSNNGAPVGKRKTVVDEVIDTNLDQEHIEEGVKPIWVNVQTLTKGSVFGLAELAFGLQPSFAVVSNGAECILLSKKFYLENADSHMMTKLRTEEYPYPTEEEMQAQLEVEMKWETFRIGTLKKTMKIKNKEKLARKSSLEVGF